MYFRHAIRVLHEVPHVRAGGVCNAGARDHVGCYHCGDAKLSAHEDVVHVIHEILDILLRAQPGDVTSYKDVKVVPCAMMKDTTRDKG